MGGTSKDGKQRTGKSPASTGSGAKVVDAGQTIEPVAGFGEPLRLGAADRSVPPRNYLVEDTCIRGASRPDSDSVREGGEHGWRLGDLSYRVFRLHDPVADHSPRRCQRARFDDN
jgi:hypothetical protein